MRSDKVSSSINRRNSKLSRVGILIILAVIFQLTLADKVSQKVEAQMLIQSRRLNPQSTNELQAILPESPIYSDPVFALTLKKAAGSSSESSLITTDPRVLAMRQFLIDYNSPIYPYADVLVTEADKSGLDWRLIASISGVESAFGSIIPYRSNNAWGWKGDPTREWSYFTSWTQGIKVVTERMALGYGTDLTPFEIEPTYCPPCGLNPEHAWANGVTRFMSELDYYLHNLE